MALIQETEDELQRTTHMLHNLLSEYGFKIDKVYGFGNFWQY